MPGRGHGSAFDCCCRDLTADRPRRYWPECCVAPPTCWRAGRRRPRRPRGTRRRICRPGSLDPQTDALLRLARRPHRCRGVALAEAVASTCSPRNARQDATHTAAATAERAGVLIAGPLGLCFLPAFVCLGIIPVVARLAGDVLQSGLL